MIYHTAEITVLAKKLSFYQKYSNTIVLTGGHFQVIHSGHIDLIQEAAQLGIMLVVAINSDESSIRKNGFSFTPIESRLRVISSMEFVSEVVENPYDTMDELIRTLKPNVYAKGGDVTAETLVRAEKEACEAVACRIEYGVGGPKVESSSRLLAAYRDHILNNLTIPPINFNNISCL